MAIPTKGAGPSASAAVAQMHYDLFTENNGVLLTNHTPDVGNNWQNLVGDFDIQSNHASGKTLPGGYAHAYTPLLRPAKNMICYWRTVNDVAHTRVSFRLKDDNNYFYVDIQTLGNDMLLRKKVTGGSSTLDSAAPTIAVTTWYILWIDITGNLIEVYHGPWAAYPPTKPGSPILSASDSDFASEKAAGIYAGVAGDWFDTFVVDG